MPSAEDQSQQQTIASGAYALFGLGSLLALVFLGLRMYVKVRVLKKTGLDDVLIMLSWALSVGTQVTLVVMVAKRAAIVHMSDTTAEKFSFFTTGTFAITPVYLLCAAFAKLSSLAFYLPLSPQRRFKRTVWLMMAIVALHTAILLLMFILTCRPVATSWEPSFEAGGAVCLSRRGLHLAFAIGNVATDILCMVVPASTVLALQVRGMQKVAILAVFFLTSMTLVTSITRAIYTWQLFDSTDPTWDIWRLVLCILVEANLFIFCGCLPTMPKFYQHLLSQIHVLANPPARGSDDDGNDSADLHGNKKYRESRRLSKRGSRSSLLPPGPASAPGLIMHSLQPGSTPRSGPLDPAHNTVQQETPPRTILPLQGRRGSLSLVGALHDHRIPVSPLEATFVGFASPGPYNQLGDIAEEGLRRASNVDLDLRLPPSDDYHAVGTD
ncbi:uncharacterized protein B0I36DRAFT_369511 [Microdochium trichocladiopsis]|uniref:Rhodopsin domain-containing protein n=1 Tax=Microdochium trichocladiopsis TaxID=1682393 RepID=A0A9P8XS87_9PEZI|nr:uncharacterized protein B0I36DRAFT_369511 [Microdochium trichocladiopsis]KAH7014570.1 hypothetical protein B0I36DRAFT_369511 [Microdochium trichocladiopsis]